MSELVSQWTAASAKRYPSPAGHVFPSSPAMAVLPHSQTVYKPHTYLLPVLSQACRPTVTAYMVNTPSLMEPLGI